MDPRFLSLVISSATAVTTTATIVVRRGVDRVDPVGFCLILHFRYFDFLRLYLLMAPRVNIQNPIR